MLFGPGFGCFAPYAERAASTGSETVRLAEHLAVSSGFDSSADCRHETVTVSSGVVGANTTMVAPLDPLFSTSTPTCGVSSI